MMHAKRRDVVRRVVAMSHCRSVQIEGLAYMPSDRATSRERATRQRAVWRASLSTMQRTMYQISHHILPILILCFQC
jgi:hypothetical protein